MASIRIIGVPAGEAPEELRKAGIGLVLPLCINNPVSHAMPGDVLGMPKNIFAQLFKK